MECITVVWTLLLLRPYLKGSLFALRTDHSAFRWILNLADATGKLIWWCLRLSQYEVDVVHWPGVRYQAANALLPPETDGLQECPFDNEVPVLAIEHNLPVSQDETEDYYLVRSVRDYEDHKLSAAQIALADGTTNHVSKPPSVPELVDEQSTYAFCRKAATAEGIRGLQ